MNSCPFAAGALVVLLGVLLTGIVSADARTRAERLVNEGRAIERREMLGPTKSGTIPAFDVSRMMSPAMEVARRKAVEKFSQALRLDPNLTAAWFHRAVNRYFLGDREGARSDAREALRLGLRPHQVHQLAMCFEGAEAREVLRSGLDRAARDDPFRALLWDSLAQTYWYERDYANYVKELETMLAAVRGTGAARYGLEYTLGSLGMGYEALGEYEKAEKMYVESGDTEDLVKCRMRREDYSGALAALQTGRIDDAEIYQVVLEQLGGCPAPPSARVLELLAAQIREGNLYYQFFLGYLQLKSGQTDKGRASLKEFVDSSTANPLEWGTTMRWEIHKAQHLLVESDPGR